MDQKKASKSLVLQKQLRLLQLRHASKCPYEEGKCNFEKCASMKNLWEHILNCRHKDCKEVHCLSSRVVLYHYSKCKAGDCKVCVPVRAVIYRQLIQQQQSTFQAISPLLQPSINVPIQSKLLAAENIANSAPITNMAASNFSFSDQDRAPLRKIQKIEHVSNEGSAELLRSSAPSTLPEPSETSATPTMATPITIKSIYPLDPISCGMYSFTDKEIKDHISEIQENLIYLNPVMIKEICNQVIQKLWSSSDKSFIDLENVMKSVEKGSYKDVRLFVTDVHCIVDKAIRKNKERALSWKKEFDCQFHTKMTEKRNATEQMSREKEMCSICGIGENDLKFEPSVLNCQGPCTRMIPRNSKFYRNDAQTSIWCSTCFSKGSPPVGIVETLKESIHNEDAVEEWVQCDVCQWYVHQVCCLFNCRQNMDDLPFVCPGCLQNQRKTFPDQLAVAVTSKKTKACDLPHCIMSKFLEVRLLRRLEIAYEEQSRKSGIPLDDLEKCPPMTIRQVSCTDKTHLVRAGMYEQYKDKGYPEKFPCRTKCILLFQTIDGQDVLLFGMFVYEYGRNCPQPNQGRVHISYVDSVHFLRPKQYRTIIYHEVLLSYLDYVKARGFHTAHIWACPPHKGDDYIMNVHPPAQKIPNRDGLCKWYNSMLMEGKKRGVVTEVVDLHTEFLRDRNNDATVLPYLEGDYLVNEIEVVIGDLKKKAIDKQQRSQSSIARKSSPDSTAGISKVRDPVMGKLSAKIEPMKEFFVVRLQQAQDISKKFTTPLAAKHAIALFIGGEGLALSATTSVVDTGGIIVGDDSSERMEIENPSPSPSPSITVNVSVINGKQKRRILCGEDMPDFPGNTEDVDDVQECEHFDSRASFLSLCQGNHYQFDQLRRAKHSSMMVLYHLHSNTDAPKFVNSCHSCHMDILGGTRYHCDSCEIDYCGDCKSEAIHPSPCKLRKISLNANANSSSHTEAQRQASLESHLRWLVHTSRCSGCLIPNCSTLKGSLKHYQSCKDKATGMCGTCKKIVKLLKFHSIICQFESCGVPQCAELKRKLAVKQQHMGDRRRMSMNSKYGSLQKTDDGEI